MSRSASIFPEQIDKVVAGNRLVAVAGGGSHHGCRKNPNGLLTKNPAKYSFSGDDSNISAVVTASSRQQQWRNKRRSRWQWLLAAEQEAGGRRPATVLVLHKPTTDAALIPATMENGRADGGDRWCVRWWCTSCKSRRWMTAPRVLVSGAPQWRRRSRRRGYSNLMKPHVPAIGNIAPPTLGHIHFSEVQNDIVLSFKTFKRRRFASIIGPTLADFQAIFIHKAHMCFTPPLSNPNFDSRGSSADLYDVYDDDFRYQRLKIISNLALCLLTLILAIQYIFVKNAMLTTGLVNV
ncbi:hypothetical protein LXL04_003328 [Taraxacum kok-saghyz]